MRRGKDGADELLVDPLPWSKDHSVSATLRRVSKDGKLLFYGRRDGGRDEVSVHMMDVDTRRDLADVLPSGRYFCVDPTPDNKEIDYSRATANGPRAYLPTMGSDTAKANLGFGEGLDNRIIVLSEIAVEGHT